MDPTRKAIYLGNIVVLIGLDRTHCQLQIDKISCEYGLSVSSCRLLSAPGQGRPKKAKGKIELYAAAQVKTRD